MARFCGGRSNRLYNAAAGEDVSAGPAHLKDQSIGERRFFDPNGRELAAADLPMQRAARENVDIHQEEIVVIRPDGVRLTMLGSAAPLRRPDGKVRGAVAAFVDISERKQNEERQRLLMAELDHRVKNVLAVVQSIAQQSLRMSDPDVAERFIGRLAALAHSHALLASSHWEGAWLRQLVEKAVGPYQGATQKRIKIAGPDLQIAPSAAQSLTLALHELVTNAAKHGSLSADGGRVCIEWAIRNRIDGPRLVLRWKEEGGPPLTEPPTRKGFGSLLLEQTLAYELDGEVTLEFGKKGLRAVLDLPLNKLSPQAKRAPRLKQQTRPAQEPERQGASLERKRILIVEDQFLVAQERVCALRDAGCVVVGPAASLEKAMKLAETEELDFAVLDLNLNGDFVWPVAEKLRQRNIPFLFTTGYTELVDAPADLASAPWLEKPIPRAKLLATVAELVSEKPTG